MPHPEPTEFQRRVLECVMGAPNRMATARAVAAVAFPEKWANSTGRGALVGHIAKAGDALVAMGLLACVLGPKDRWCRLSCAVASSPEMTKGDAMSRKLTKLEESVVKFARERGQLAGLCVLVDYDPDTGRVPEHWIPRADILALVEHLLGNQK